MLCEFHNFSAFELLHALHDLNEIEMHASQRLHRNIESLKHTVFSPRSRYLLNFHLQLSFVKIKTYKIEREKFT